MIKSINSKKVLSVALLSVLVLTALTGCTGYSSTGAVPEVAKVEETPQPVDNPTDYENEITIDIDNVLENIDWDEHQGDEALASEQEGKSKEEIAEILSERANESAVFSVTTPTVLPITITEDGEVLTADNATIINNSESPILIEEVQIKGIDGWEVVAFGSIGDTAKVNTKQVAYQVIFGDEATGTIVNTTGEGITNLSAPIRIEAGETLPLTYTAEVPVQTMAQELNEFTEINFILGLDNQ